MLVTVWVFIGIEGASVYSQRAARRRDVGRATVLGFAGVLALLLLVNVLSYGLMAQADLAGVPDPSMAGVLENEVGSWEVRLSSSKRSTNAFQSGDLSSRTSVTIVDRSRGSFSMDQMKASLLRRKSAMSSHV